MRAYNSYLNFNRCIFKNNKADDYGGAIYFWSKGSYYFYDCLFYKNWTETDDGGAVGVQSSTSAPFNDVYFINCTYTYNTLLVAE
jgi:predicted outer membrane repeat protein